MANAAVGGGIVRSAAGPVVLALLLVVAGVSAVAALPNPGAPASSATPSGEGTAATATQNGAAVAPGTRLGGTVGVERAAVDGRVAVERLEVRLADADSAGARAAVLDDTLTESAASLDALEGAADEVGTAESAPARAATLAAHAEALGALLDRSETAATDLPAAERERYDLLPRVDALSARATTLRERFADQAATIDGAGVGRTTATPGDVVAAYENALADGPGVTRTLFGSETVVVRVREGDGSTTVTSLRTRDGRVVESSAGERGDATVRVSVEGAVVQRMRESDDPAAVFTEARERGALTYRGVGLANRVKFGAASIGEGVADLLGG